MQVLTPGRVRTGAIGGPLRPSGLESGGRRDEARGSVGLHMRNTKQCPKCRSHDLLTIPGWVGGYGSGNNIPIRAFGWRSATHVLVTRFVCGACGFSEEWIEDPKDIARLRERYGAK